MKVGSLFSGMEGFGHGFKKAGMKLSWWVEKEKNCIRVLEAKHPDALGVTDVTEAQDLPAVDLISFGWPCQDLSVAGNREGLAGSRSGLFWEAMRIVKQLSPQWIVGENVPGLLSSEQGRDMGAVIRAMEELGYCVSWAMLDTQYFHLAQRRERLFFVGSLGNTNSIQVLFESDCGPWDIAPSREKGKRVADSLTVGANQTIGRPGDITEVAGVLRSGGGNPAAHGKASGLDENLVMAICNRGHEDEVFEPCRSESHGALPMVAYGGNRTSGPIDRATACNAHGSGRLDFETETFVIQDCREIEKAQHGLGVSKDVAYTLDQLGTQGIVKQVQWASGGGKVLNDSAQALRSGAEHNYQFLQHGMLVRRLTPTECLRLQGFPDDYLDGLGLSDSAKYRMIGNSVSPVIVEWIGRRIMEATKEC